MAELMEEGNHIVMREECWLVGGRLREVAHASSDRDLSCFRIGWVQLTATLLQSEASGVTVFTFSRE